MSQRFDIAKPRFASGVLSEEMRLNYNAAVSCNSGANAPADPDTGWLWLDTSDPTNYKLNMYVAGAWFVILTNVTAGAPSQSTVNQFVHTQAVAAAVWTIQHNLDSKDLNITFWDTLDTMFWPSSVVNVTANQTVATFGSAKAGRAVVLG